LEQREFVVVQSSAIHLFERNALQSATGTGDVATFTEVTGYSEELRRSTNSYSAACCRNFIASTDTG